MEQSIISQYLGWAAWILLLIPLVILVRLLSRRSRWSILRMVLVSLSGLAVISAWLHFAETTVGAAEGSLAGKLGGFLAGKLTAWTGQVGPAFAISTVFLFLWAAFALMDAVIATARFYINKPYVREVVREVVKEVKVEKEAPAKKM